MEKDTKSLSNVEISTKAHTKLWAVKKSHKYGSIRALVREVIEEWADRDSTEITYATYDELQTVIIRMDKVETQLSLLRHAITTKTEDQFKQDEYRTSDLLNMSWPRLKTLCAKYGLDGVKDHHAAIMVLRNKVTLIDDLNNEFTEDTEQTEQTKQNEEDEAAEEVHFCKYCSQRDHLEDKCPHKKEDKELKKHRPPTPCQKCGGFHGGKCKMNDS